MELPEGITASVDGPDVLLSTQAVGSSQAIRDYLTRHDAIVEPGDLRWWQRQRGNYLHEGTSAGKDSTLGAERPTSPNGANGAGSNANLTRRDRPWSLRALADGYHTHFLRWSSTTTASVSHSPTSRWPGTRWPLHSQLTELLNAARSGDLPVSPAFRTPAGDRS
ncbi:MAG: hypothetical protein ACRDRP_06800 [Pseudonocardiaceae bacterium]